MGEAGVLSLMGFLIEGEVGEAIDGWTRQAEGADGAADENEDEQQPTDE